MTSSGASLASLTPYAGLELMLRLYDEGPEGGDLSCSWGDVSRYGDATFGVSITRRFETPPYDPLAPRPCTSLSLKFKIGPPNFKIGPPSPGIDFPGWMVHRRGSERRANFRSRVEGSAPFKAWGWSPAAAVALDCQDTESWAFALFDCWGIRDPSRPVVSMTEEEWLRSDDVPLMLRWFRQEWRGEEADLDNLLHRYCLACCRRIWRLLPAEESRSAVAVAERFVDGLASPDEYWRAEWLAEVTPMRFALDPEIVACWSDQDHTDAARWCEEVSHIPSHELNAMISSPLPEDDLSPRGLLTHAASFAHSAMCYPGIQPKESIEHYRLFLPAQLLREVVGNSSLSTSCDTPA